MEPIKYAEIKELSYSGAKLRIIGYVSGKLMDLVDCYTPIYLDEYLDFFTYHYGEVRIFIDNREFLFYRKNNA